MLRLHPIFTVSVMLLQEEQTHARMSRLTEATSKNVEELRVVQKELAEMQDKHRKSR